MVKKKISATLDEDVSELLDKIIDYFKEKGAEIKVSPIVNNALRPYLKEFWGQLGGKRKKSED